jgi:methionyl-tRNA formyltransferase
MSTRIVFMGSPDFALPSLRALAAQYPVVGVVTQPDRASGRGRELRQPPVKTFALELGIPVLQPEKLLKPDVLDLPRFGCINVHASLLPRWRGAAPINAALLAGDEETGVTIMKMDVGLDTGPTLAHQSIRLTRDDTAGSVTGTLSTLGADLLLATLPDFLAGKLTPSPQPAEGVTYAPMLKKEDGRLDFTRPAAELERRVRAMNPWPGAWFEWDGTLLKVARATVSDGKGHGNGSRFTVEGRPAVMCADDALVLEEVQPAGKKVMLGKSFLAGARGWAD